MTVYERTFSVENAEDTLEFLRMKEIFENAKDVDFCIVSNGGFVLGNETVVLSVYMRRKPSRIMNLRLTINGFKYKWECRARKREWYGDNYVPVKALIRAYKEISGG